MHRLALLQSPWLQDLLACYALASAGGGQHD